MGRTLVIAEPGCTHEGDYATMVRLLETAHACGADVFKPQWTSDPVQMCERRHIGKDDPKRAYYERAYGWLAFPTEWHEDLSQRCHALGMGYACTCFLPQDVATVAPYIDRLKIASFEAMDKAMWLALIYSQKRAVISTGMCDAADLMALRCLPAQLLQCTSAYPVPLNELHIDEMVIQRLNGLSDHSRNVIVGAVAVGAGAEIVEAHFRLKTRRWWHRLPVIRRWMRWRTCDPQNPDYPPAFSPAEFAQYISHIREAERAMGDGVKKIQPCEEWALPYRVTS